MQQQAGVKRTFFRGSLYARRNPYPLMLALAMGASALIFLFIIFMMAVRKLTTGLAPIYVPRLFYMSSAIILVSSGTLWLAIHSFRKERYRLYLNWCGITFGLGLLFSLSQIMGWMRLLSAGLTLQSSATAAFIYVLSGLHFFHMLAALFLLGWTLLDAARIRDYVDGYIASLNPAKRTRLQLTHWFWHFIDALWLVLFGLFLLLG